MIGLAYMRRELWPQAELFLALCEKRAVPGDQPPDWIDEAEHQLAAKLSAAQIPAVTIAVTPADADAHLTVSTFAPDEVFAPQTVHLVPGKNVLEVTAPGFRPQQREITVHPGEPVTIRFDLEKAAAAAPPPPHKVPASSGGSTIPWIVMGIGVALTGAAVVFDVTEVQPARDRLAGAQSPSAWDAYRDDFEGKRTGTIGLLVGGATMIALGAVLRISVFRETSPQVTAQVGDHSALLTIGWQR
jgi:hypothetical protein